MNVYINKISIDNIDIIVRSILRATTGISPNSLPPLDTSDLQKCSNLIPVYALTFIDKSKYIHSGCTPYSLNNVVFKYLDCQVSKGPR